MKRTNLAAAITPLLLLPACVSNGGDRAPRSASQGREDAGFYAGPGANYPSPSGGYDSPPPPADPYGSEPVDPGPQGGYGAPDPYAPPAQDGYAPPPQQDGYSGPGTSYPAPGAPAPQPPRQRPPQPSRQPAPPPRDDRYSPPPAAPDYADPAAGATGPRGSSQVRDGEERYDQVGYAGVGIPGLGSRLGPDAVAAANRTLPAGTIVEVTALDTGRTILAVVTDRGPPRDDLILDLSVGAARGLGISGSSIIPVRVRKVNAAGQDEADLKAGRAASQRLDAPAALITGLRRSLPPAPGAGAAPRPSRPSAPLPGRPSASTPPPSRPAPAAPRPPASGSGYYVQVAVISNAANARSLASSLKGVARPVNGAYRVQIGPFRDAASANRARADAAARGYRDAFVFQQ